MNKHIIFDMDETIGYFKQFIIILNIIETYHAIDYNIYFELFEEFFRPQIFNIFEYIISKKQSNQIKYVILYTNNNNDAFVNKVIKYIHKRINGPLFDHIITHNTSRDYYLIERKTHRRSKSYDDLINCIPDIKNDSLCFIDDKIHICMKRHPNVSYIKCEKYIHTLSHSIISNRLIRIDQIYDKTYIEDTLTKHKLSKKELPKSVHNYSSKKMLQNIEIFIYDIPP